MRDIKRMIMTDSGRKFYVKDISKDFHCQYGMIRAADLKKDKAKTNTGKEVSMFDPSFCDIYTKIKRLAQIIPLKDVGVILAETGITKKSIVVDAGAGSGALALFIAQHAKKVYSFDIREDHLNIAKFNKDFLKTKNIIFKKHDIYENIPVKDVDVITLDVPEPWKAIKSAEKALKMGGFIMSYSPSIPQVQDFVNAILENDYFVHLKSVEITEREWEVDGRKVRPKTRGLGHSGFLSFARRV